MCFHDVAYLGHAYQCLDQLEKKENISTEKKSIKILQHMAQKIEKIAHNALAEEIITIHHLKQFKISPGDQPFASLLIPQNLTLEKMKEIALHLPFCESEQAFDKDVKALFGQSYSPEIAAILQVKRNQFHWHQEKEQRVIHLKGLREQNASFYPPYLEEILQEGSFHLYDHLINMKALSTKMERSLAITKLSFSSFAKIILEFRKIVLSKVEKMITQDHLSAVFLLGNTGSGKSTTLCYLRGDQMVLKEGAYQSLIDEEHLIGNDTEASCTLFPNMTVRDNLLLVDFPGFSDTHGEVISLAIELTLRTLARKYSPKIVLIASITDTESRFEHVHLLGKRLERVLGTLDHCLLGLTKYSKDADFIGVQTIENSQREELFSPSQEEENITQQILALTPFAGAVPAIQAQLDQLQERLQKLQALRSSSFNQALPDTEEKSTHYNNILQKEEAFKKHSGIKNILSFKDLTDQKQLEEVIQQLSSQDKNISLLRSNQLDAADEKLLEALFKSDLIHVITSIENPSSLEESSVDISQDELSSKIEAFSQSILETSLINTLLSKSHPEIGEFLHLESMDPSIVRKYDQEVITGCINSYIDKVVSDALFAEDLIKNLERTFTDKQRKAVNHELYVLKNYILTLSIGASQKIDSAELGRAWEAFLKKGEKQLKKKENELELSLGMKALLLLPLGIPYGIFTLFKKNQLDKANAKFIEETADSLCQKIKAMSQAIVALKDLETLVKKQDHFDKILSSNPLTLNSIPSLRTSLEKQISQVKKIYGEKEWDARVDFLTAQLIPTFSSVRLKASPEENILYALIAQEVSWEQLPPYFNEHTFLALICAFLNLPTSYQEIIPRLFPGWKISSYQGLKLNDPSHFFHTSSITQQEYHFLQKQGEILFEQSSKNSISRLLIVDAIRRLWNRPFSPTEKAKGWLSIFSNDQAKIVAESGKNEWILEYSKEHLRSDKNFILSAVKLNGKVLAFASDVLKNNQEIVLSAGKENGEAFQYASDTLKNNREFILAAIEKDIRAFEYASDALRNDREFALSVIKKNVQAFKYTSDALRSDREFVLSAIEKNVEAFEFTSDALRNDREFVLFAIEKKVGAFKYASDALRSNKEFVFTAVEKNRGAFLFINKELKSDREFILALMQKQPQLFEDVNEELKSDREFILAAVKKNDRVLQYVSNDLKNERDFFLSIVQHDGKSIWYASEALRNDRKLVLTAVQQDGLALEYVSDVLKNNMDIALAAVRQNGLALEHVNENLKNNKEMVLLAIQKESRAFNYASFRLKNNREFILDALQENGLVLEHVEGILKHDKDIVLTAVRKDSQAFTYASLGLKNNRGFIFAALQKNAAVFQYINDLLKNDKMFILAALQKNGLILEYISEALRNDRGVVLTAIQQNGQAFEYVSETLKNDHKFVLAAVQKNGWILQYVSEALKKDVERALKKRS
ncbi:hypothetical protein RSOCI_02480 [Rhabdochlamydiaceae symbiont of Dictyostelium giganteum]